MLTPESAYTPSSKTTKASTTILGDVENLSVGAGEGGTCLASRLFRKEGGCSDEWLTTFQQWINRSFCKAKTPVDPLLKSCQPLTNVPLSSS